MINERPGLPGRRKQDGPADCGAWIPEVLLRAQDTMTSGMTAFMVAVGGTSLICYLLMNRVQNRKTGRDSTGGDSSGTSSNGSSGGDGWNPLSWFGNDSSSSDSSTSSSDSGGDSGGGGGDSGGGGD
jgi:hypothetical protein